MKKTIEVLGQVRGILCDIDGTLYSERYPTLGAIDTFSELGKTGIKLLFLTNTDSKAPRTVYRKLMDFGFSVEEKEILKTKINWILF